MQHSESGAYEYIDSAEVPRDKSDLPDCQHDSIYNELEIYESVEHNVEVDQPDTAYNVSSTTNDQNLFSHRYAGVIEQFTIRPLTLLDLIGNRFSKYLST